MRLPYALHNVLRLSALAPALLLLTAAHPGLHTANPAVPSLAGAIESGGPEATVEAFHAALARGDTSGALALLDEAALIFESGNVERGRAEYAAHHLAADAAFSAAVGRTLVERSSMVGGDIAIVTSTATVAGTYLERSINSRSLETMVLRRGVDGWRIVHIHWSSDE